MRVSFAYSTKDSFACWSGRINACRYRIRRRPLYAAIESALNEYIASIDFNGLVYTQKVIDSIQNVEHVTFIVLNDNSSSIGKILTELAIQIPFKLNNLRGCNAEIYHWQVSACQQNLYHQIRILMKEFSAQTGGRISCRGSVASDSVCTSMLSLCVILADSCQINWKTTYEVQN